MDATMEAMKAKAREDYAILNTRYSDTGGVRQEISGWYEEAGHIIKAGAFIQLRGQIYSEDWLFHACRDAAEIVEREADGRPWAVIQTMMGCTGPACVICQRGNME